MKHIILSLIIILFAGCANKQYLFVPTDGKCIKKTSADVGIEEVRLPYYMNDLEIMKLKKNILVPTHKYLSKEPTEIIITKLSNILCDPNVFMYPWGSNSKYKVSVKIDDFYFKNNNVILSARIYVNSKYKKISVRKQCKSEYNCVNEAFNILINEISKEIK